MKKSYLLILAIVTNIAVAAVPICTPEQVLKEIEENCPLSSKVEITVKKLNCPVCTDNIINALKKVSGIKSVSSKKFIIEVTFTKGAKISRKTLENTIGKIGFSVIKIKEIEP